jgi:hypothetical protein
MATIGAFVNDFHMWLDERLTRLESKAASSREDAEEDLQKLLGYPRILYEIASGTHTVPDNVSRASSEDHEFSPEVALADGAEKYLPGGIDPRLQQGMHLWARVGEDSDRLQELIPYIYACFHDAFQMSTVGPFAPLALEAQTKAVGKLNDSFPVTRIRINDDPHYAIKCYPKGDPRPATQAANCTALGKTYQNWDLTRIPIPCVLGTIELPDEDYVFMGMTGEPGVPLNRELGVADLSDEARMHHLRELVGMSVHMGYQLAGQLGSKEKDLDYARRSFSTPRGTRAHIGAKTVRAIEESGFQDRDTDLYAYLLSFLENIDHLRDQINDDSLCVMVDGSPENISLNGGEYRLIDFENRLGYFFASEVWAGLLHPDSGYDFSPKNEGMTKAYVAFAAGVGALYNEQLSGKMLMDLDWEDPASIYREIGRVKSENGQDLDIIYRHSLGCAVKSAFENLRMGISRRKAANDYTDDLWVANSSFLQALDDVERTSGSLMNRLQQEWTPDTTQNWDCFSTRTRWLGFQIIKNEFERGIEHYGAVCESALTMLGFDEASQVRETYFKI